jgi:chemotaxis protein methyltransferase CheR
MDSLALDSAERPPELLALLSEVHRRYGYDFRDYAVPSLRRRIRALMHQQDNLESIADLQRRLSDDCTYMERFVGALSTATTALFRDPRWYAAFRSLVVPHLRTRSFVRVWSAGCSSGEEVYSLAILFREEGVARRCLIYATDLNEAHLEKARAGVFPVSRMQEYTRNYIEAGGAENFSDYYTARYGNAILNPSLVDNVVFARHNLVTDRSFNEFDVILCRNVMIYFNTDLQNRCHRLFYDSLGVAGFLGLGTKESIRFTPHDACYKELARLVQIFQKTK